MHGLHIKPQWQPAIPATQRSFTAFFQPIFPQLAKFHWIYPDTLPFAGSDIAFETLAEASCAEGYLPPDTLLPKFATFINEDWTDLYGFHQLPDVTSFRQHLCKNPADYPWLSRHADICLFNVDGAWWEIYARDPSLLETIRAHAAHLPYITIQERHLTHRDIRK